MKRHESIVAYHEAGHAAAAQLLHVPYTTEETIIPGEGSDGMLHHPPKARSPFWQDQKTRDELERDIIVSLAGPRPSKRVKPSRVWFPFNSGHLWMKHCGRARRLNGSELIVHVPARKDFQ